MPQALLVIGVTYVLFFIIIIIIEVPAFTTLNSLFLPNAFLPMQD